MIAWVDGALVDDARARVSAFDHGLTVGDGVFETIKVLSGQPFALTRHLRRLEHSAAGLGLPAPDIDGLRLAIAEVLAANPPADSRLRITVTGGPSPLGSTRGPGPATVVIGLAPLGSWAPAADVVTVAWPRNERSAVAGLKTTSYAENVVALQRALGAGASEALLPNTLGNVCEGTGSNVFVAVDGHMVTPPLSAGCLAGVTRALVLEWTDAQEQDLPMDALVEAEEVFLTSSTRDVQAVRSLDGRPLPAAPGPLTVKATAVFAERAALEPDP